MFTTWSGRASALLFHLFVPRNRRQEHSAQLVKLMFMESSDEVLRTEQISVHPSVSNARQKITCFPETSSSSESRKANMFPVTSRDGIRKGCSGQLRAQVQGNGVVQVGEVVGVVKAHRCSSRGLWHHEAFTPRAGGGPCAD